MGAWYKDWFASEFYLNVYSHRNTEEAEAFLTLLVSKLDLNKNDLILDAACGAGRHSIYLNKLGFNTVGFDLSRTLLNIARRDSNQNNIQLKLINADKRRIYFKKNFKAIFSLFTSFGYFEDDEENYKFVKNGYGFLEKGGYFVLDYLNKNHVIKNINDEIIEQFDEYVIIQKKKISTDRVVKDIEIKTEKGSHHYYESVKLYEPDDIIARFERIGFNLKECFGEYDGQIFTKENSSRFIAIFQK